MPARGAVINYGLLAIVIDLSSHIKIQYLNSSFISSETAHDDTNSM